MSEVLDCVGCRKTLPITRFSKVQRREMEPECISCIQWRGMNAGDSLPTPPPGVTHALRAYEKSGTIARVLPTVSTEDTSLPSTACSSTTSISNATSTAARAYGFYDADDMDAQDDATQFSSAASSFAPPTAGLRYRATSVQTTEPAPRFSQNLPGTAVRTNTTILPSSSASNHGYKSSGASSAYRPGTSEKPSTRSKPKFNRHGYGSASAGVSSQHGGESIRGMSSTADSAKEKASRKWPKGDNRKKFDVLPNFE